MALTLYEKFVPVGIFLAIFATSFLLGLVYGQVPYTVPTLFGDATPEQFQLALVHYQTWSKVPFATYCILFTIGILGFFGLIITVYKPKDNLKLYDYFSLACYFFAVCVFITNIKTGIDAAVYGNWGEVDMETGINVIGASQCIAVFLLVGVLVLQAGRYYQYLEDVKYEEELKKFFAEEASKEKEQKEKEEAKKAKKDLKNQKKYGHDTGVSTGVDTKKA